jgi:hypothetical protein
MKFVIYFILLGFLITQPGKDLFDFNADETFEKSNAKPAEPTHWEPRSVGSNFAEAVQTLANCKTLEALLDYVPGRGTHNLIWIRDLDFRVKQFKTYGLIVRKEERHRINIIGLIQNDSIQFGLVELENKFLYFKNNISFIQYYVENHNNLYKTNFNYNDFHSFSKNKKSVQIACGYAGTYYAPEAKIMLQSVQKADKKPLNLFIRSIVPEIQAYGVIGLLAMKERCIALSKEESRIVKHLLKQNAAVEMCVTCVSDKRPLQAALHWVKVINDSDFDIVNGKFERIEN